MTNDYHEQNRLSWNEATKAHNSHKGDQAKFLHEGGNFLYPEEMALLGNLEGKTLVHLQCNSGQDTLSIVKYLGAQATGIDISDEAIAFAQQLAQDSGIPATFIRTDLYDWFEQNEAVYDVVFTSYGTVVWLSDVGKWAQGVASCLQAGAHFVMLDFHPSLNMFDNEDSTTIRHDYMGGTHYQFDGVGDYVADAQDALLPSGSDHNPDLQQFKNPYPSHEFAWGIGDILGALCQAGFYISHFVEYNYSNGFKPFPDMVPHGNRRFTVADNKPKIPLMFSLVAHKAKP